MPRFYRASETVIAEQWGALGDLPDVVQQYQRSDVANAATCVRCGRAVAKHGWIAAPLGPMDSVTAALPVDLTSGQPIVALPQALPASGPEDASRIPTVRTDPVTGKPITVATTVAPGRLTSTTPAVDPLTGQPVVVASTTPLPARTMNPVVASVPAVAGEPLTVRESLSARSAPLDPERGDLSGLVVCPGNWVVTYKDGEREVMDANTFKHLWVKADPFAHQVA